MPYRTHSTLGTAAFRILHGKVDPEQLPDAIALCAWCQIPRPISRCWQYAVTVILANRLQPPRHTDPGKPTADQLEIAIL
jgi:hypothetical protein